MLRKEKRLAGRISRSSLREQIHDLLLEAIITSEYPPGSTISIDQIAEDCGVSATPVREALVALEAVGLVKLLPNKGVYFSDITQEDVDSVWEVRRVLEPYAAKSTVLNNCLDGKDEMALLTEVHDKLLRVMEDPDNLSEYIESDLLLHRLLFEHLPNKLLISILRQVNAQYARIRYVAEGSSTNGRTELVTEVTSEHLRIVHALMEKDADRVEAEVLQHLLNSESRTRNSLSAN